ncbi:MAG: hypothetical protein R6X25_15800 [Candidatus Krumholzibacteriia bacterium]
MTPRTHHAALALILAVTVLAGCLSALAGCVRRVEIGPEPEAPAVETELTFLPLAGRVARADAEISSLVWHGDQLLLLPQRPDLVAGGDSSVVFVLDRQDILDRIDGISTEPLLPREVLAHAPRLSELVPGYDGLEAAAMQGDRIYLIIETNLGTEAGAFLVAGRVESAFDSMRLDLERIVPVPISARLPNMSFESLVVVDDRLVAIQEANGLFVNPEPGASAFTLDLEPLGRIPGPAVEFRLTDATAADAAGRFWVINYFFPGERELLLPAEDAEVKRFGQGLTHGSCDTVERLLEFRIDESGLVRTPAPPIAFRLRDDLLCRNWEGVARLDDRGFLLITDRYPATLLAFAPFSRQD